MKTMIFGYVGPISDLQKALDERIEQLEQLNEDDLQSMGDCIYTNYNAYQYRHYDSGCDTI